MVRMRSILAWLGVAAGCGASPGEPASAAPRAASAPSASAEADVPTPTAKLEVVHRGAPIEAFTTLTRTFSPDEGLPSTIGCESGRVPWLAGGRSMAGGFVVCLPEKLADGVYESPLTLSLSRGAPLGPRAAAPSLELIHAWWMGQAPAKLVVRGDRVDIQSTVTLMHRTHPASFTGGVPDEVVELRGTVARRE
jgi:hypothetical protein